MGMGSNPTSLLKLPWTAPLMVELLGHIKQVEGKMSKIFLSFEYSGFIAQTNVKMIQNSRNTCNQIFITGNLKP